MSGFVLLGVIALAAGLAAGSLAVPIVALDESLDLGLQRTVPGK